MSNKLKAVCFGEVLWDCFPNGKRIGGAPLNVALRLQSLGVSTSIVSRVGRDKDGEEILKYVEQHGLDPLIQTDENLETGKVKIWLDENRNANYEILNPVAWDNIQWSKEIEKVVSDSEIFIFGSLICRNERSRGTLYSLLKKASFKVLDINLRKPLIPTEILLHLMNDADFIKFNEEEIIGISAELGFEDASISDCIRFISDRTKTKNICVTRGVNGVILYMDEKFFHNSGYKVPVKDTVGAGDSFLAALMVKLKKKTAPMQALDYACAIGSLVASREGANAEIRQADIAGLMWTD